MGITVEMVQFFMKLLLKQRTDVVYHDFHWLLIATKLLEVTLHFVYVKKSEIWKGQSWDILPSTP